MLKPLLHFTPPATTTPEFDPDFIIIRMPELETITGFCRPTIYKRLKDDPTFPRPVPLSDSTARGAPIGFVLAEVQQWVRSRIARRELPHPPLPSSDSAVGERIALPQLDVASSMHAVAKREEHEVAE